MHLPLTEALTAARARSDRYAVVRERRGLEVGLYAPAGSDPQSPHDRDELYVVVSGSATFVEAGRESVVAVGDAIHVAAHTEHRFTDLSADFAAWVVFDRRPAPRLVSEGDAPSALDHPRFRLRPLGPEHNDRDYGAWTSSTEHIRATPGFADMGWPHEMTLEENEGDLRMHASHFATGRGYTYTVLAPEGPEEDAEVLGCVYLYPDEDERPEVRSWVRADHADLDAVLHETLLDWLTTDAWPWTSRDQIHHHPR